MPTIQQIKTYLQANGHVNSSNPVTADTLANYFHISDGGVEVDLRNIIRDAINHGELIGSNNHGFFLINSLPELENYLDSLESRASSILHRRNNLIRNWNRIHSTNNSSKNNLFVRP